MDRLHDMDANPTSRRNGIQVVSRVADVLRALGDAPAGLSLSELAAAAGMPKSTVHRLVGALEAEDLVTSPAAGKIRLGRGVARLGAATRDQLREQIHPYLVELHQQLEETVDLAILDGNAARFIDHIDAPHRLRAVSAIGATFPLYCTANGKALLAALREEQADALLPARLSALTQHTITTRKALREELDKVRAAGVAVDREEHSIGISAVGCVISDPYGPAAAISVPVPTQRFRENEDKLTRGLIEIRQRCSAALGA
jgi:DNA-binding IclR family transcriptional regulator